jgi:hypothetical protein
VAHTSGTFTTDLSNGKWEMFVEGVSADSIASTIHGATAKTTPVDADEVGLIDSAASNVLKKLTWSNIKATLKSYFDSVTTTLTNKTLSSPLFTGTIDGWISAGETWTYASATTFTISGDKTGKYQRGDKIKLTQTSVKYFYVTNVSYSSPNTTVTVNGMNLYTLADATITNPYYSKMETPQGYPDRKVNLYSSAGTTSTITLPETSENFVAMEIFFKTSNGSYDSVKVITPNGKYVNLVSANYYDSVVYMQNCVVTISGTSITFGTNTQVSLGTGGVGVQTGNYIYITRVDGYRDILK